MHRLLAICVLLATATDGVHSHLLPRWSTRGQLPALGQHAAAANRDEALPRSAVDTAWSKAADNTGNNVMYFVETKQELTKQELFVFGNLPAQIMTPETTEATVAPSVSTRAPATSTTMPTTSTSAPATSTSEPATSTSAPATSTSEPATSTSAPSTSTTMPTTSTSAPATSTSEPATSTSAPSTSTTMPMTTTSAPATSTSEPATSTSVPNTSSNTLLPSSTIPSGYTYYPETGSYYKLHLERRVPWDVANTTCASEGAHLLVINDAKEADVVARVAIDVGNWGMWTGLRDLRPGGEIEWRTVHGEPLSDVYNEWWIYKPRPYNAQWLCAYFFAPDKRLDNDEPCDFSLYFTCEISR